MAYGLRYTCGYTNIYNDETGRVAIYEEDYTDSVEALTTKSESIKIKYNWKDWNDPLIGLSASFAIVNDESDFFDLLPLMTAEERKYWIVIEDIDHVPQRTFFEGFLDCKDIEQKYLHNQEIRLNASGYLSKLQYVNAPTIETLENDTFINIILNCLEQTGNHPSGFTIYVNCSLYPIGCSLSSSQTLFNKCGIYKEVFWKDNIERDSALDVVKKILESFNCYLFWWNGNYYIERYADIWNTSPIYVRYSSGTEYWPSDSGSALGGTKTITDFVDLVKTGRSQTLSVIPGQKQVELNIEQRLLFNFVVNNFEDAATIDSGVPYPDYRKWDLWSSGSSAEGFIWPTETYYGDPVRGVPFRNINRSLYRSGYEPDNGSYEWHRGMYHRFRVTITDETTITIKFKFGVWDNPFLIMGSSYNPEDYYYEFNWYLRNPIGNYFISYNDVSETWERVSGTEISELQYVTVSGSAFDQDLFTVEIDITIPMHEVFDSGVWGGDQDFILGICTEKYYRPTQPVVPHHGCYYGDVEVTCNAPVNDNYISGAINTNFLNKLTFKQHLLDASDLSVSNAIFYNDTGTGPDDVNIRTEFWDDSHGSSGEGLDLSEMRIKDKFRLFNVSRQKIVSSIKSATFYRPLSLFNDSNQDNSTGGTGPPQFVLVGDMFNPQTDEMDIILSEYDNEEDIRIQRSKFFW
jgi:hypothetical protein